MISSIAGLIARDYQASTMDRSRPSSNASSSSNDSQQEIDVGQPIKSEKMPPPPVSLSFSIARLINNLPEQRDCQERPTKDDVKVITTTTIPATTATATLPTLDNNNSNGFTKNPLYPIPMWAQPQALPWGFSHLAAVQQPQWSRDAKFNQMLCQLLHTSALAPEAVTALVHHYQQMYANTNISSAANLHKVEILRSAAAAAANQHFSVTAAAAAASATNSYLMPQAKRNPFLGSFF